MSRIKLNYVNSVRKGARIYRYFRRAGSKRIALPGLPGSPEFMAAYQDALEQTAEAKLAIGADRTVPGTVNAVIAAFYTSATFTKNRPITRQTDRNILEAFRVRNGDKRIAMMEERHVRAAIDEKAGKPAAQRNLLRVLRVLLTFAVEQKLRKDNPAAGIKLKKTKTTGFHTWTDEEVCQFEARHPVSSKARLALALLLYTAQRRSDVVRLGPAHVITRDGKQRFVFTQTKTGTAMDIPVAPPLAEIIAATPMVGMKTYSGHRLRQAVHRSRLRQLVQGSMRPSRPASLQRPWLAKGVHETDGRGQLLGGLHRQHQRPPHDGRDQDVRAGGEQGAHGRRRHGKNASAIPREEGIANMSTANFKYRNCQLLDKPLPKRAEISGMAGVAGLRTCNPRFWRPVL